jgi:hypothetical protein
MSNDMAKTAAMADSYRRLKGRIISGIGLPAGQVKLRLYHRGLGKAAAALLSETKADERGDYSFTYDRVGVVNLEVRAVDRKGNELALSAIKFGAAHH